MANNRRVAKNSVALYVRMLISMIVSFYTSRVVLEVLGVDDYGIYNVVGGITASFAFLNASMAGASSRFITFEIGRGSLQSLKETFSSSLIIHIGVCIIVLVLAETIGLWFLNCKLEIPQQSMMAANIVYQCSVLSLIVSITQVPYNACIIAHERMGVYAYIEIANVILKLLIVYLLYIGNFNKLILYGFLMLGSCVIIAMVYRIYCIQNFKECRFILVFKKGILVPMLSFSGWDFYGNMCVTARNQGSVILLNMFFGVGVNAASGLASTIYTTVSGFAGNIMTAFKPQIIKEYSQGNYPEFEKSIINASKFTCLSMIMMSIPVLLDTDFILRIWLTITPEYTVSFIRICLIATLLLMFGNPLITGIHATGKMRYISIVTGSLYLINLLLSYLGLKIEASPQWVFISNCIANTAIVISNMLILHRQCPSFRMIPFMITCAKVLAVGAISFVVVMLVTSVIDNNWMRLLCSCTLSIVAIILSSAVFVLNSGERALAMSFLKARFK